jgi:NAD(P)-dependent dehydrogenase (short-subunit alcohol dehydrogenase family)
MNPRICLITGGADGLGLALATRLAASSAVTCLFDIHEGKLAEARNKLGDRCRTYLVDICNASSVSRAVQEIIVEFHRIDVLVNCAGITEKTGLPSHEVPVEDFDRVFAVNVRGSFLTCQAVLPHMLRQNQGRILNIASIAGKEGNAGMVAYSASKAAVIGMTKSMGKDYAETGVTVNALAPAVIRTALVEAMPDAQVRYMTDKIPMKRCGTLEEFAAMAEFIVSPANSFTTGFTFDLSGGRAVY